MNWLSENYKWVFDGIGAAALIGLIAWLWRRFFKEPAEKTNTSLTAKDSQVTNSPVASGSGIIQNVIHFQPQPAPSPALSVPTVPATQDKPRPNMQQVGARVDPVNEFSSSRLVEDPTGKAQAFLIQFTNEARLDKPNAGAPIKALLIYENDGVEVFRTIGSWMAGDFDDWVMFRVDESRRLIVGVLFENNFTAIGMFRPSGSPQALIDPHIVPAFQTVRIRLTHASAGDVLYEGQFRVTLNPLGIVPEYVGRGDVRLFERGRS
jgi:hypothetical protein